MGLTPHGAAGAAAAAGTAALAVLGIKPSTEPPVSREHHDATLGLTLRSAGLGKASTCFLCAYTDEKLAEGSIFGDTHGPIGRVTRLWQVRGLRSLRNPALAYHFQECSLTHPTPVGVWGETPQAHADTMDGDLLAADCHKLLMQLVSAYAPPPPTELTSAAVGDTHGSGGAASFDDVTPSDIKRHFTVCMTTHEARMTTLKASFRHVAQLGTACSQGKGKGSGACGPLDPAPFVALCGRH
jgi:hypothetical protein